MEKKKNAKAMALKAGYQALRNDMQDMLKGDSLKSFASSNPKKMMKVSVAADSEKDLEKGLSKAQQILKAKFNDMPTEDSNPMEEEESEDLEECPMCKGEGCKACEKEMPYTDSNEESEESIEELKAKLALLQEKIKSLT